MKAKSGGGLSGGSRTTQPVNPGGLSQYGTAQGGRLKGAGSFTGINSAKAVFEGSKTAATPMGKCDRCFNCCRSRRIEDDL
jgi:hypothetical protein